jgi:hypothetical protein
LLSRGSGVQPGESRRWEISRKSRQLFESHARNTSGFVTSDYFSTRCEKRSGSRNHASNNLVRKGPTSNSFCDNPHTMARKNPNIVITGTPGVGKTTHAEQLARATGFQHISVNQIVKDEGFHEGKDEETGSWIVDEDKVRIPYLPRISIALLKQLPAPRPP